MLHERDGRTSGSGFEVRSEKWKTLSTAHVEYVGLQRMRNVECLCLRIACDVRLGTVNHAKKNVTHVRNE